MKFKFTKKAGVDFREPIIDEPFHLFSGWLMSDVQSKTSVKLVSDQINKVKTGLAKEIHSDGNAFVALLQPDGIIIWDLYTDKRTNVLASHDEVLELLEAWAAEIP
jgi:hypothetical protein